MAKGSGGTKINNPNSGKAVNNGFDMSKGFALGKSPAKALKDNGIEIIDFIPQGKNEQEYRVSVDNGSIRFTRAKKGGEYKYAIQSGNEDNPIPKTLRLPSGMSVKSYYDKESEQHETYIVSSNGKPLFTFTEKELTAILANNKSK